MCARLACPLHDGAMLSPYLRFSGMAMVASWHLTGMHFFLDGGIYGGEVMARSLYWCNGRGLQWLRRALPDGLSLEMRVSARSCGACHPFLLWMWTDRLEMVLGHPGGLCCPRSFLPISSCLISILSAWMSASLTTCLTGWCPCAALA